MEHCCRLPRRAGGGFSFRGGRTGLVGQPGGAGAVGGMRGAVRTSGDVEAGAAAHRRGQEGARVEQAQSADQRVLGRVDDVRVDAGSRPG